MELQLNKLMAGLVLAGSAVALVGCGGGDAPTLTVQADAVAPINAANIATTKVLVEAASGAKFTLPALTFTKVSAPNDATAPADSVLEIVKKATPVGNEFADFTLTSGTDGTNKVEGVIEAGSCRFKVTASSGTFASSWIVGQTYVADPCAITLQVENAAVGSEVEAPLALTLGTQTVTSSNTTVTVTVEAGDDNTAEIKVGDTVITEEPLPTGAPS